jgi:hypothetical protein
LGEWLVRARKRVRMHLVDESPRVALPSVEGVLLGFDHALKEYRLGVPELLFAAGGNADKLDAKELRLPRERVAFYEVVKA